MPQDPSRPGNSRPRLPPCNGLDLLAPLIYAPPVGGVPPRLLTPYLNFHERSMKQASSSSGVTLGNVSSATAPCVQESPRIPQAGSASWTRHFGSALDPAMVASHFVPASFPGQGQVPVGVGEPLEQQQRPQTPQEEEAQITWRINSIYSKKIRYCGPLVASGWGGYPMPPNTACSYPIAFPTPMNLAPTAMPSQPPQAQQQRPQLAPCIQEGPTQGPQRMPSSSGVPTATMAECRLPPRQPKQSESKQEPKPKKQQEEPKRAAQTAPPQKGPTTGEAMSATLGKQKADTVHFTQTSQHQPPEQNKPQQTAQPEDPFTQNTFMSVMATYLERQAELVRKKALSLGTEANRNDEAQGASEGLPPLPIADAKMREMCVATMVSLYMLGQLPGQTPTQPPQMPGGIVPRAPIPTNLNERPDLAPPSSIQSAVLAHSSQTPGSNPPKREETRIKSSSERVGYGTPGATSSATLAHCFGPPPNTSKQDGRRQDAQVLNQQSQKTSGRGTPQTPVLNLSGAAPTVSLQTQLNKSELPSTQLSQDESQILGGCARTTPLIVIRNQWQRKPELATPTEAQNMAMPMSAQIQPYKPEQFELEREAQPKQQHPGTSGRSAPQPPVSSCPDSAQQRLSFSRATVSQLLQMRAQLSEQREVQPSSEESKGAAIPLAHGVPFQYEPCHGQGQPNSLSMPRADSAPFFSTQQHPVAQGERQNQAQSPFKKSELRGTSSGASSVQDERNKTPQPTFSNMSQNTGGAATAGPPQTSQHYDVKRDPQWEAQQARQQSGPQVTSKRGAHHETSSNEVDQRPKPKRNKPNKILQKLFNELRSRNSDSDEAGPGQQQQLEPSNGDRGQSLSGARREISNNEDPIDCSISRERSESKQTEQEPTSSRQPDSRSQLEEPNKPTLPHHTEPHRSQDENRAHEDTRKQGQDDSFLPQRPSMKQEPSLSTRLTAGDRKPFSASDDAFAEDLSRVQSRRNSSDSDEGRLVMVLSDSENDAENLTSRRERSSTLSADVPPEAHMSPDSGDFEFPETQRVLQGSDSCKKDPKSSPSLPFERVDERPREFNDRGKVPHECQMQSPEILTESQQGGANLPSPGTQKNQKFREIFEKEFSDLRRIREEKERLSRMQNRSQGSAEDGDSVENDAEVADAEKRSSRMLAAEIPELLRVREQKFLFVLENRRVHDFAAEYEKSFSKPDWSDEERAIFRTYYIQYPKLFDKIAAALPGRTMHDCVRFYYLSKNKEKYRRLVPKRNNRASFGPSAGSMRRKHPPAVECFKCKAPLQTAIEKKGSRLISKKNCAEYGLTAEQLLNSEYRACFDCRCDSLELSYLCPMQDCQKRVLHTRPIPVAWRPTGTRGKIKECCETCFAQLKLKHSENEWTTEEVDKLLQAVKDFGFDWAAVASAVGTKDDVLCERYHRLNVGNSANSISMHENSTDGSKNHPQEEGRSFVAVRETSPSRSDERFLNGAEAEFEVHGIPKMKDDSDGKRKNSIAGNDRKRSRELSEKDGEYHIKRNGETFLLKRVDSPAKGKNQAIGDGKAPSATTSSAGVTSQNSRFPEFGHGGYA